MFHGSASGIAGRDAGDRIGVSRVDFQDGRAVASVASAGDVNGDGYADVIVGADRTTTAQPTTAPRSCSWAARRGSVTAPCRRRTPQLHSHQGGASLGFSVASAGDVNGDGYSRRDRGRPLYDARPDERRRRVRVPGQCDRASSTATPTHRGRPARVATRRCARSASAWRGGRRERRRLCRRDRGRVLLRRRTDRRGRGVRVPGQRPGIASGERRDRRCAARVEPGRRASFGRASRRPAM